MNLDKLQKKLITAARVQTPRDQVPYAFEKRITALLVSRAVPDSMSLWIQGLWRAAASCVAVTLLLGAWALYNPENNLAPTADFSQNFESTLLASVDQSDQLQ